MHEDRKSENPVTLLDSVLFFINGALRRAFRSAVDTCFLKPRRVGVQRMLDGRRHGELPPGPKLGLVQVIAWNRDPLGFFRKRFGKYGDPFTTPFLLEAPVVVTAAPDGVAEIFAQPSSSYEVFAASLFKPIVGQRSMFSLDGERHREERKLLAPAFHGQRLETFGALIVEATRAHIARLPVGEHFIAQNMTQSVALDVILRAVFGIVDEGRRQHLASALTALIEAANPAVLMMPWLRIDLGPLSPGGRLARAKRQVKELIFDEIRLRRARTSESGDVLGMMLRARYEDQSSMSDEQIHDELLTAVLAGHETTASALAWALHHCLRQPDVLQKLRDELRALGPAPDPMALGECAYLEAVCNETLRIHPVVVDVVRRLRVPLTLRGRELPPGVAVCAATLMTHRDPRIFENPDEFIPERFMNKKYSPYEFYPFGGGNRRCIGAAFAMFEMKLVLAVLVMELELKPQTKAARMKQRNIAWGPRGGIPLLVEARR